MRYNEFDLYILFEMYEIILICCKTLEHTLANILNSQLSDA